VVLAAAPGTVYAGADLLFAPGDEGEEARHVDSIWPIWNVLDMTPGGRGTDPDFLRLHHE
jgi:predicted dithiol-disulfide oxidoreductase (DUF899 family)